MPLTRTLFDLGRIVTTEDARAALGESGDDPQLYLDRHVTGDWGELRSEEETANILALAIGGELFSRYRTSRGDQIGIMTDADRSSTYIYLDDRPSEGETMENDRLTPDMFFGSFTSAVGLALGELLVLTGKSDELPEYLREIHVAAQATIICAGPGGEPVTILRQGVTLSDAALRAVRAWSADPQDPADLDDCMALLSKILVEMGVLQSVDDQE